MVTGRAKDRPNAGRFERDDRNSAAIIARHFSGVAWIFPFSLEPVSEPTTRAAFWLVCELFSGVKFLLTGSERKRTLTNHAG